MNDGRVPVTVLGFDGGRDGRIDIPDAHDRNKRHHLLFNYKGMILVGLAKQQIGTRGRVDACGSGQHRDILADQILLHMRTRAAAAAAFEGKRRFGEPLDGRRIQLERASATHGLNESIGDGGNDKDLFFADAEQVVIEGRAFDDASGGAIKISGLVHDHRRIAGAARDDALAGFGGCLGNGGAAGNAQQRDFGMMEDLLGGFDAGFAARS